MTHVEDPLYNNLVIITGAALARSGRPNTLPVDTAQDPPSGVRGESRPGQPGVSLETIAKAQAPTLDLTDSTFVSKDCYSNADFLEVDLRNEEPHADQPESSVESEAKAQHPAFDFSQLVFDFRELDYRCRIPKGRLCWRRKRTRTLIRRGRIVYGVCSKGAEYGL